MSKRRIMQFGPASIHSVPDAVRGVYAFWCRDLRKFIYIGQAQDQPLKDRLRQHWRGSHNETLQLWIKAFGKTLDICYLPLPRGKIRRMERLLIQRWNPEANIRN